MTQKRFLDHAEELLKLRLSLVTDPTGLMPDWLNEITRFSSRRHKSWTFLERSGKFDISAASPTFLWPGDPIDPDRINIVKATSIERIPFKERSQLELVYDPKATGEPVYWSFDANEGPSGEAKDYKVMFYPPVPDQTYTMEYHGSFYLPRLAGPSSTNRWLSEYFLMTMLGVLWWGKLYLEGLQAAAQFWDLYNQHLQSEIELDKQRVVGDEDMLVPRRGITEVNVVRELEWGLPGRGF